MNGQTMVWVQKEKLLQELSGLDGHCLAYMATKPHTTQ